MGLVNKLMIVGVWTAVLIAYVRQPITQNMLHPDEKVMQYIGWFGRFTHIPLEISSMFRYPQIHAYAMRFPTLPMALMPAKSENVKFSDDSYNGVPVRIYTPKERKGKGAVVYIHGGGWVVGSVDGTVLPVPNGPKNSVLPVETVIFSAIYHANMMDFAEKSGRLIVSIDYRLAPEHPFPVAPDDCEKATRYFLTKGYKATGTDPKNVVIAGDSAGGNLATVVSLRLKAKPEAVQLKGYKATGTDPKNVVIAGDSAGGNTVLTLRLKAEPEAVQLKAQVLIYPVTQLTNFLLPSYVQGHAIEHANNVTLLSTATMADFLLLYFNLPLKFRHVLLTNRHVSDALRKTPEYSLLDTSILPKSSLQQPVDATDLKPVSSFLHLPGGMTDQDVKSFQEALVPYLFNPDISPLHAKSLEGLPQAYIVTAGFDILRDEGILYAARLNKAGVPVTHRHYEYAIHGFHSMNFIKLGNDCRNDINEYLDRVMGS